MKKYAFILSLVMVTLTLSAKIEVSKELNEALVGIQSTDQEVIKTSLTYILRHKADIPSSHLFFASAQAYALNKLEIAGFLYYAGQLRAKFDLQRFPPIQVDGDSPAVTLATVMRQVGSVVNPEIFKKPEIYAKAIENLAKFPLVTSESYDPGWDYHHEIPVEQQRVLLLNIAKNELKQLADFSLLLNNKDYFNAFRTVQDINSLSEESQSLQTYIVDKQNAEKKMLEIETELNLVGLFYKGETK